MPAAHLEDPAGRELAPKELFKPVGTTFGQVEAAALVDVRQGVVFGLSLKPIVSAVEFTLIRHHTRCGRPDGRATDKCAAGTADMIILRVGKELRVPAPTRAFCRREAVAHA